MHMFAPRDLFVALGMLNICIKFQNHISNIVQVLGCGMYGGGAITQSKYINV